MLHFVFRNVSDVSASLGLKQRYRVCRETEAKEATYMKHHFTELHKH